MIRGDESAIGREKGKKIAIKASLGLEEAQFFAFRQVP